MSEQLKQPQQEWKQTKTSNTTYWTTQLPDKDYHTRFLLVHQRQAESEQESANNLSYPFIFAYDEHRGVDHWFGGRAKFGHDHKFEFGLWYFNPNNSGDFIAGETITWIPHYVLFCIEKRQNTLDLDPDLRKALTQLPDQKTLDKLLDSFSDQPVLGVDDYKIQRVAGAKYQQLFSHYQEPSIVDGITTAISTEYRKRAEQNKHLITMSEKPGETKKTCEPDVNLTHTFDKKEFLLELLERTTGYNIHTATDPKSQSGYDILTSGGLLKILGGAFTGIIGVNRDPMGIGPGSADSPNAGHQVQGDNPCGEIHNTPQSKLPEGYESIHLGDIIERLEKHYQDNPQDPLKLDSPENPDQGKQQEDQGD